MKKLLILLMMLGLFFVPYVETQAYTIDSLDEPISELNGLTLREVFEDGNMVLNPYFIDSTNNWINSSSTFSLTNQILTVSNANIIQSGAYSNIISVLENDLLYAATALKASNDIRLHVSRNNLGFLQTIASHSQNGTYEILSNIVTMLSITNSPRIAIAYRSGTVSDYEIDGNFGTYAINLTTLGLTTLTLNQINYYLTQYITISNYINGYDQGNLDGYAEGLGDNTAYVQGYNVGYTDGLTEGVDMETGSSIIVLVLAIMAFALMLFGFASKRRIFNLFASGLFIALGGILFEYPAFIIVTIGLVIVNVYYTFVSD